MAKELIQAKRLTGERALFAQNGLVLRDCTFDDGESPLKECSDIEAYGCLFKWKYPIWYSNNVKIENSTWFEMARAGVWYTDHISISDSVIQAPKNFRRCKDISMKNVTLSNASETLWHCDDVSLERVVVKGDYFAMDSENLKVNDMTLVGNYSFDGVKNAVIESSKLVTKDAFWNTENVTVRNSFVSSEYLGWNAKNLTLENCTVESLQGMCYIDNLVMKNCKLLNTTLAFEYSTVDADIVGSVDSVLNPSGGRITADSIGELIIEKDRVDPQKTTIICRNG